jgi:hypothetical protein
LEEIGKLARIRNQFAHYLDLNTIPSEKEVLCFLQFRDRSNLIYYSEKEYFELIDSIDKCNHEIEEVLIE